MKRVLPCLLLFVFTLFAWSAGACALTLRVADVQEEGYPTVQALKHFGGLLAERSGGRILVEVFHSSQLGDEKESIEQCRAGGLDMVRTNLGPLADLVPEAAVVALPYLFRSETHLRRVLDGAIGGEILESLRHAELVGLCFYDSGARSFYAARRPLLSPDDFKGVRIRVQQTEIFKMLVEALGAVPVPMPYGQVNDALRTGLIEGAENNLSSYHSTGHYKSAPYYMVDEHSMSPEVLVFSARAWAVLPEADRQLIRQAARDSVPHMRGLWRKQEELARKAVTEGGARIFDDLDREPFVRAMSPVYERFAATPRLRDMVRRIQSTP